MRRTRARIVPLAAIAAVVAGISTAQAAAPFTRSVSLRDGASASRAVDLPAAARPVAYWVSVTGPRNAVVTVDLRGRNGSVKYPGIATSEKAGKRLSIYTFRPLGPGRYQVVLRKAKGPAVTVRLEVTPKPVVEVKPMRTKKP